MGGSGAETLREALQGGWAGQCIGLFVQLSSQLYLSASPSTLCRARASGKQMVVPQRKAILIFIFCGMISGQVWRVV